MRLVPWTAVFPIYVTILVVSLAFTITFGTELNRYELTIAITAISFLFCILAMWSFQWRRSLPSDYRCSPSEFRIVTLWRRSLSKLQRVISLSHERISLTQTELEEALQDKSTHIYALIAIGYKCIQTSNAIHVLCARGFPDQALFLCRGLVEQEANLRFIVTIENREEVTERYLDWERAKTIRWKTRNEGNLDSTNGELDALKEEYEQLRVKYRGKGRLRNYDEWAIGTRANDSEPIEAFSVPERAKQFISYLASDEARLHDTWFVRWQRLNEFAHTTPRSIFESAASNDPKLIVTEPSHLGIDEPLIIAGQTMLSISNLLTEIVTDEFAIAENPRLKDIGTRALSAFYDMLEEVKEVPGSAAWWHTTVPLRHRQSFGGL